MALLSHAIVKRLQLWLSTTAFVGAMLILCEPNVLFILNARAFEPQAIVGRLAADERARESLLRAFGPASEARLGGPGATRAVSFAQ